MIVKILSSASSFAGVGYNEDKVEKGVAQLMAVENFGMLQEGRLGAGDTDYVSYFQSWSKGEDGTVKVRHPQFHAVISCEGREKSGPELKEIAEQYLEKMGYSENPYLIYFHTDTANNHVHMVSSRINREGRKIDDSFERTRSQKAIKEILLQDMGQEIRDHLGKAMEYGFSTVAQFKLLLEQKGVKISEEGQQYQLVKYGAVCGSMDKDTVAKKIAQYQSPDERVRQLRMLFAKYRSGLLPDQFQDFMKAKFGVELIFHQAKGNEAPYGYSILDHSKKQVLKGSQVMKLAELLSSVSRADRLKSGRELVEAVGSGRGQTFGDFRHRLAAVGFTVDKRGAVRIRGEGVEAKPAFHLEERQVDALHYNERRAEAQKYSMVGDKDKAILAKVFRVEKADLTVNDTDTPYAREVASDKLNSALANGRSLGDTLAAYDWQLVQSNGSHYLIDKEEKYIHDMADLTRAPLNYGTAEVLDLDRVDDITQSKEHGTAGRELASSSGSIGEMLGLMASLLDADYAPEHEERRRKKKNLRR